MAHGSCIGWTDRNTQETVLLGKTVETSFYQFSYEPSDSYMNLIKSGTIFILSIAKWLSKP